jgi:hypothetical protein
MARSHELNRTLVQGGLEPLGIGRHLAACNHQDRIKLHRPFEAERINDFGCERIFIQELLDQCLYGFRSSSLTVIDARLSFDSELGADFFN